jgi:uncharacterized protein (DUF2267 family)
MKSDEFLKRVKERTGLKNKATTRATEATLQTLAEHLAGREAEHVAAQLPRRIAGLMAKDDPEQAEGFSFEEFVGRVAAREEVSRSEAIDHARAVMMTLYEAASEGELKDMRAQLPEEFDQLFFEVTPGEEEPSRRSEPEYHFQYQPQFTYGELY